MKNSKLFTLILMIFVVLAACSNGEGTQSKSSKENELDASSVKAPKELSFASATVGGLWYTLSGSMSEKIQSIFNGTSVTVTEGGSVSNIIGIEQGIYDLAFSTGQTVKEAVEGKGEFQEPVKEVSAIATLYPNVFHIVVRADSNIYSIEDLKGKKVSPGVKGYSTELTFKELLHAYGMSYEDLSGIEYIGMSEGADLLRDGHIDAIASMIAVPVSTFQELDTTLGIRVLPLEADAVEKLRKNNTGYLPYAIAANSYKENTEDTPSIAAYTDLLVSNALSEDVVYEITKMIFEETNTWSTISSTMNEFTPEYSIEKISAELHPGAKKYYKELGLIE